MEFKPDEEGDPNMDVSVVFGNIYSSCDTENTNAVCVSQLIEFIKPYMMEDLEALEELRMSLDPENKDVPVSAEVFKQHIYKWSKKLTGSPESDPDFNRTPSRLNMIDDRELPYLHSTPRASLGDRIFRCKDLLNLSVVSGYSLSTSKLETTNTVEPNNTIFEEEVKKLHHQLSKTMNELTLLKNQLASSEEANEAMQSDIERLNRRLVAEQQINELLQKDKVYNEELKDEISACRKTEDDLRKKLSNFEKEMQDLRDAMKDLEEEKIKAEKKVEILARQKQDILKENFELKTETDTYQQQIIDVKKINDELKAKFIEQKDLIDQLKDENDILSHQRQTLEKALKTKSSTSPLEQDSPSPPLGNGMSISNLPNNGTTAFPFLPAPPSSSRRKSKLPLLKNVLVKQNNNSSNTSPSVQSSTPLETISPPRILDTFKDGVLSPVSLNQSSYRTAVGTLNDSQNSSEEDIYWKIQQQNNSNSTSGSGQNAGENLQTEICKVNPAFKNDSTVFFESQEQIFLLEDEINNLKKSLKEFKVANETLQKELKDKIKAYQEQLDSNSVLSTNLDTMKSEIDYLQCLLKEKKEANMQNKCVQADTCDDEITNLVRELHKKLKQTSKEEKKLSQQTAELMKEFGQLTMEKIALANSLQEDKIKCKKLFQQEIKTIEKKMHDQENVVLKLNEYIQVVIKQNEELENTKKKLEEDLFKVKKEFECIKEENIELRNILGSQEGRDEILSLKSAIKNFEEKLKNKENEVNALTKSLKDLEYCRNDIEETKEFKENVTHLMQSQKNIFEQELTKKEEKIKKLKQDLEVQLNREVALDFVIKEKEQEIQNLKKVLETLLNKKDQGYLEQNKEKEEQVKLLDETIKQRDHQIEKLKTELEKAMNLNKQFNIQLKEKQQDLESALKKEMKNLELNVQNTLSREEQLRLEFVQKSKQDEQKTKSLKQDLENALTLEAQLKLQIETQNQEVKNLKENLNIVEQLGLEFEDKLKKKDQDIQNLKQELEIILKKDFETQIYLEFEKQIITNKGLNVINELKRAYEQKNKELENKFKLKEQETDQFKQNLEKRLMCEFEEKVKNSIDGEEKMFALKTKCDELEKSLIQNLSSLTHTCEEQTKKIASLQKELEELSSSKIKLDAKIEHLQEEKTKLELEKVSLGEELETLNSDSVERIQKIKSLEKELEEINSAKSKLEVKMEHIQEEKAKLEQEKISLEEKLEFLNSDSADKILNQHKTISALNKNLEDTENRYKDQVCGLKNTVEDLKVKISQLNKTNSKISKEQEKLAKTKSNLEEDNFVLKNEIECLKQNNEDLNQEILRFKNCEDQKINLLKLEFDNDTSKLKKEQQEKILSLNQELEQLKIDLDAKTSQLRKAQETLYVLTEKCASLEKDLNSTLHNLYDKTDLFEKVNTEWQTTETELKAMFAAKLDLEKTVFDLKHKVEKFEEEKLSLEETQNKLEDALKDRENTIELLQKNIEDLEKDLGELKLKNMNLIDINNNQSQELQCIYSDLQKEKDYNLKNKAEIDELKTKFEKEKLSFNETQNKLENLLNARENTIQLLQKNIEDLEHDLAESKLKNTNLIDINNNQSQELQSLYAVLNEEKGNNDKNKAEIKELKNKLEDSIIQLDLKENTLTTISEKLEETKIVLDKAKSEYSKLLNLTGELRTKNLQKENNLRSVNVALEAEKVKCSTLSGEISLKDQEIKKVSIQLIETKTLLGKSEQTYQNLLNDVGNKEQQNIILKQEINQLKSSSDNKLEASSSTDSLTRPLEKRTSYSKQQIALERLKERLENIESELKIEKRRNNQINTELKELKKNLQEKDDEIKALATEKLSLEEIIDELKHTIVLEESTILFLNSKIQNLESQLENLNTQKQTLKEDEDFQKTVFQEIQESVRLAKDELSSVDKELQESTARLQAARDELQLTQENLIRAKDEENRNREGKSRNKFTLSGPSLNSSRPSSPDSPSCHFETTIELPNLTFADISDEFLEEIGLNERSPRKKLTKEETEKKFASLAVRLFVNAKDVEERFEKKKESYKSKYEEFLSFTNDISFRLRDHICIGTSEPIGPVFILLEELKLRVRSLAQSASEIGIVAYESRMKRCWNLVTNYMAMLRKENEILNGNGANLESTPTQTTRNTLNTRTDNVQTDSQTVVQERSRNLTSRCRTAIYTMGVMAFAITVALALHLHCRLTVSENQYCPLDDVITREVTGIPPM